MPYALKFKDKSRYVRYDYSEIETNDRVSRAYPNCVIVINTDRYKTPNFKKTDLDGHVWEWDGTNLTISGTNIKVNNGRDTLVPLNRVVLFVPNGNNNSRFTINAYQANITYTTTASMLAIDSATDYINGYGRKQKLTLSDFYTEIVAQQSTKNYDVYNYVNDGATFDSQKSNGIVRPWDGYGGTYYTLEDFKALFPLSLGEHVDPIGKDDPYNKGGSSSDGGGGGTFGGGNTIFGGNSDSIDIPQLPTASASSAGFITLFNPSLAQLNNLANYMWSDLFSLDTFKKIFADPMDCILGLSIVPVKPASAGTSNVKIGNVSTDVAMNKTSSQYVAVDCGTIDVKEYWGAYLDYAPYTQCEIYLPYVGTKQISVDDVMNKAVHVVYHVDILSGACNAYVKCGDSVLYTFVGQCSSSIPISGNDWTNVLNGAISVAGKIGLAMATGGATALMSGLGAASSIISSSKPTVERSGAMSSTGGLLGIQKPYLILTRPKQALPENQNKYTGYPSFITMALSDCTGYTEIDSVHLENMSCTDEEAQEIENLLKSGVIF